MNEQRVIRKCAWCARGCDGPSLWKQAMSQKYMCVQCMDTHIADGAAVAAVVNGRNVALMMLPQEGISGKWTRVKQETQRVIEPEFVVVSEEKPKKKRRAKKDEIIAVFRELE